MYRAERISEQDKAEFYTQLGQLLTALIGEETDWLANMANAAGLLFDQLDQINWAGFYLLRGNDLVLGPYQGKPACTRIPLGKGVCGTAAAQNKAIVVEDVHKFPGHIACDALSQSEIVLPITVQGKLIGVLDIDSPITSRFNREDELGLGQFLAILEPKLHELKG